MEPRFGYPSLAQLFGLPFKPKMIFCPPQPSCFSQEAFPIIPPGLCIDFGVGRLGVWLMFSVPDPQGHFLGPFPPDNLFPDSPPSPGLLQAGTLTFKTLSLPLPITLGSRPCLCFDSSTPSAFLGAAFRFLRFFFSPPFPARAWTGWPFYLVSEVLSPSFFLLATWGPRIFCPYIPNRLRNVTAAAFAPRAPRRKEKGFLPHTRDLAPN